MVSGSNGQRAQLHGNENQDLRHIKVMVDSRHQEKEEGSRKREDEATELGRCRQGEDRTPEVNLTVQEYNVE